MCLWIVLHNICLRLPFSFHRRNHRVMGAFLRMANLLLVAWAAFLVKSISALSIIDKHLSSFSPQRIRKVAATAAIFSSLSSSAIFPSRSYGIGPTEIPIEIANYKQVELCDGRKPIMPGQKAAQGLFPVCIEVEAEVRNPKEKETLKDVSIYGFVKENDAGNSVLPNNPDFSTDSGQYAMIKSVSPGKSTVTYQFVAAVSGDPKKVPLPKLTFFKTKAISFPGGDRFKPLGVCEIDPRAEGCEPEDGDD